MIDWAYIGRNSLHPTQIAILEYMGRDGVDKMSPSKLADELDLASGNVSYHVKALRNKELLVAAGTQPVRGATEHFYRLSPTVVNEQQPEGAVDAA